MNVRIEHERALSAYREQLKISEQANHERKNAVRYHKAKFFGRVLEMGRVLMGQERQKATRRLHQAEKALAQSSGPDTAALREKVIKCKTDLLYTLQYPNTDKYISLYRCSESQDPRAKRMQEWQHHLWSRFEQQIRADPDQVLLDENNQQIGGRKPRAVPNRAARKASSQRGRHDDDDDNDDDDDEDIGLVDDEFLAPDLDD